MGGGRNAHNCPGWAGGGDDLSQRPRQHTYHDTRALFTLLLTYSTQQNKIKEEQGCATQ